MTQLPRVRALDLNGPGVSPQVFAELKWPTSLQSLDVSGSKFTDEALMNLANCPNVLGVTVQGSQVTPEGIRRFQQARPGVVVK